MKTATITETAEIKRLFDKYNALTQECLYLDHNEKRGKKAACTRAYTKLIAYIESVSSERSDKILFRLINA